MSHNAKVSNINLTSMSKTSKLTLVRWNIVKKYHQQSYCFILCIHLNFWMFFIKSRIFRNVMLLFWLLTKGWICYTANLINWCSFCLNEWRSVRGSEVSLSQSVQRVPSLLRPERKNRNSLTEMLKDTGRCHLWSEPYFNVLEKFLSIFSRYKDYKD